MSESTAIDGGDSPESRGLERILFFGTPDFAVPTLEALVAAGRRPVAVVSQPSRRAGRGRRLQDPPVVEAARRHELPVLQPERVRAKSFRAEARELAPDVAVVVAFGQIFPRSLLRLPRAGCVNLHASLLPAYRGAAPIQAAIAAGEKRTGVCSMVMEAGLDTGPVLLREEVEIGESETGGELTERLALIGGPLIVRTLEALEAGTVEPKPQESEGASYAPRIQKQDGWVDWTLPARSIFDRLRALTPWPGGQTVFRGQTVKILWGEPSEELPGDEAPGTILGLHGGKGGAAGGLAVRCGGGTTVLVERLQKAGKKPAAARDFANGERLQPGDRFEIPPEETAEPASVTTPQTSKT